MSTNQPHDPHTPTTWQPPQVPAPPAPQNPDPARRSWFARHKILTGLLACVLIAIIASAVNGGGNAAPTTSSPSGASRDNASAGTDGSGNDGGDEGAGTSAKVGQKVRDGQFEFTVTRVTKGVKSVGDQYLNQKAQGAYVLVSVTVTNVGDSAQLLADSSQKLRDAKGREFSADTSAAIYLKDNKVFLNEINPGNSVKGTLVFDMPKGTAPASIELHDSPFSDGVTVTFG